MMGPFQQPMMFDPNAQQQMMQQGNRGFPGNGGNNGGQRMNGQDKGVCDYFARTGNCRFGATCKFQHIPGGGGGGGGGQRTTGTKLTANPATEDDLPADLVLDYDDVEHSGKAAKALVWGTKPLIKTLAETKDNGNGKRVLVNKPIAVAGPTASKLQQIALHAHTSARNDKKVELGNSGSDELLDELLAICKKRAPYPHRLTESNEETQAVKDEITELKDVLLGLAKNAEQQQETLHNIERKQHDAKFEHRVTSEYGSYSGSGAGSGLRASGASSLFGSGSRSHTRVGIFSPGPIATPMGRRPRKTRLVSKRFGAPAEAAVAPRGGVDPAVLHAAFADGGVVMSDSDDDATPRRDTGGGGSVPAPGLGPMPAMPSMEPMTVSDLCNDPVKAMQNIPSEEMGWKFADQLTARATELLADFKKVPKAKEDPILEANPTGDKYGDILPKSPVGQGDITHQVQLQDLGRLATVFVPYDFSLANDEYMAKVLDCVKISQRPLERVAAILKRYGVEMTGLPSFKLGLVVIALSIAKDRRDFAAKQAAEARRPAEGGH